MTCKNRGFCWVLSKPKHPLCSLIWLEAQGQQPEQCQEGEHRSRQTGVDRWPSRSSKAGWLPSHSGESQALLHICLCFTLHPACPCSTQSLSPRCRCLHLCFLYLKSRSKAIARCPWHLSICKSSLPGGNHLGSVLQELRWGRQSSDPVAMCMDLFI